MAFEALLLLDAHLVRGLLEDRVTASIRCFLVTWNRAVVFGVRDQALGEGGCLIPPASWWFVRWVQGGQAGYSCMGHGTRLTRSQSVQARSDRRVPQSMEFEPFRDFLKFQIQGPMSLVLVRGCCRWGWSESNALEIYRKLSAGASHTTRHSSTHDGSSFRPRRSRCSSTAPG